MSLDQAIELGEYNPEYLAQFPQWQTMSKHMQFELIKKALVNRRKQLLRNWMEVNQANDYRLKPDLHKASEVIENKLEELTRDKEKLYAKYTVEE